MSIFRFWLIFVGLMVFLSGCEDKEGKLRLEKIMREQSAVIEERERELLLLRDRLAVLQKQNETQAEALRALSRRSSSHSVSGAEESRRKELAEIRMLLVRIAASRPDDSLELLAALSAKVDLLSLPVRQKAVIAELRAIAGALGVEAEPAELATLPADCLQNAGCRNCLGSGRIAITPHATVTRQVVSYYSNNGRRIVRDGDRYSSESNRPDYRDCEICRGSGKDPARLKFDRSQAADAYRKRLSMIREYLESLP